MAGRKEKKEWMSQGTRAKKKGKNGLREKNVIEKRNREQQPVKMSSTPGAEGSVSYHSIS